MYIDFPVYLDYILTLRVYRLYISVYIHFVQMRHLTKIRSSRQCHLGQKQKKVIKITLRRSGHEGRATLRERSLWCRAVVCCRQLRRSLSIRVL